jgi:hypothetical protein
MRRLAVFAAVLSMLAVTSPAHAEGWNNLKAGVNGILTFPADPVALTITPPEKLEDMPGYPVTGRVVGLVAGTLLGGFRLLAGVYDVGTFPFWVLPTFSPEPRFELIPGIEME